MEVDVAFTPAEALRLNGRLCVVVDQLRASSTIVTLLDGGCSAVVPVAGIDDARQLARGRGYVLAGEEGGVPPEGFDYGNSPTEFAAADVAGQTVVLRTVNGTRVAGLLAAAPALLIGCLLNAAACAAEALTRARDAGTPLAIVCAGRRDAFALDDALAAGALVERIRQAAGGAGAAEAVELTDAAQAALALWHGYPDPAVALRASATGRNLVQIGLERDIAACARVDASRSVPVLAAGSPPRFVPAADAARV